MIHPGQWWRQRVPGAVGHMVLSTFFFNIMFAATKAVSHLPGMEVIFFRCFIAGLLVVPFLVRDRVHWIGQHHGLLIARGTVGTAALLAFYYTITRLPLATAVVIQYLSTIFSNLLAVWLLGERMGVKQWLFYGMAFSGVMVIKGFDPDIPLFTLGMGLLAAALAGLAYNLVRQLSGKEPAMVVVLHFQIIGALSGALYCLLHDFVWPVGIDWLYLGLIGWMAFLGQQHLTLALHSASIGLTAGINYLGVVFALLFGVFFFQEHYAWYHLLGMGIVVAGVIGSVVMGNRVNSSPT